MTHLTALALFVRAGHRQRVHHIEQGPIRFLKLIRAHCAVVGLLGALLAIHWVTALSAVVRVVDEAQADNALQLPLLIIVVPKDMRLVYEAALIGFGECDQLFCDFFPEVLFLLLDQFVLVAELHHRDLLLLFTLFLAIVAVVLTVWHFKWLLFLFYFLSF